MYTLKKAAPSWFFFLLKHTLSHWPSGIMGRLCLKRLRCGTRRRGATHSPSLGGRTDGVFVLLSLSAWGASSGTRPGRSAGKIEHKGGLFVPRRNPAEKGLAPGRAGKRSKGTKWTRERKGKVSAANDVSDSLLVYHFRCQSMTKMVQVCRRGLGCLSVVHIFVGSCM